MTVQQVIDLAKEGELKNIAVKQDNVSILGFINLGMIELYKRFPLNIKEHIITIVDGIDEYTLPSDCLWVVAAYGEVLVGDTNQTNELAINEEDNPESINIVSWNTVQIPGRAAGVNISLIYRAAPVYLTEANDLNPETGSTQIEIPLQLLEALLHYIGYRAHNAINGKVNSEYTTHYTLFEQACKRVEDEGMLTSDDMSMKTRIANRGFL